MKIINMLSLAIILLINTYSIAQENGLNENNKIQMLTGSLDPNGALMTVAVEGMVCDFCAQAIEKVFMKREEVTGITINLEEQNVIIALKQNNDIEDSIIKELFLASGYNVAEIDRKKH